MLIRSQDKETILVLENTSIISAGKVYGKNEKGYLVEANKSLVLGEYETKEKALAVIDEICKACQDGKILFEMP